MVAVIVILVVLVVLAGAWLWYINTPGYKAAQATHAATQAALQATDTNPTGLQRGVYDTIEAAKAQRRLGANVDPGQAAVTLVRNSYLAVPSKWNEERSVDISDPARRVNIMNNLAGMVEATVQLFVASANAVVTQDGMDAAKAFFLQMVNDAIDRRDCWWHRDTGCWRNWSTGEPHEDDRLKEEQHRIRDMMGRILPALESSAKHNSLTIFAPDELTRLHARLLGGDVAANPYDEDTFNHVHGWLQ